MGEALHPRQRLAGRRRLEVDRRRARRGRTIGLADTQQISARARPPDEPGRRLRRGARPHVGPEPGARHLPLDGRRQDLEEGPLRRRQDGRDRPRRSTRRTRESSTPASGRWRASRGPSRAAARAAASGRRRTAATPGRSSRAACPRASSGSIGVAVSPARPERVWAIVEAEKGGALPHRRRRRDVDAGQRREQAHASAPGTTRTSIADPDERRRRLRPERRVLPLGRRRQDLRRDPDAARRQPRPLDRPERPGRG